MARVKAAKRRTPKKRARELKWPAKFLSVLASSCNVSRAARLAKVGRQTAYDRRTSNAEFAKAWDHAIETGVDALEYEARRRAMDGYRDNKRYSDLLMIFLLKAHRPEKYRDNFKHEQEAQVNLVDLVGEAEARAEARKREREEK
jgi:hypothetical protein